MTLEKIKLSDGLIAVGSEERKVKTTFAIHLANEVAKEEKVLFLNWFDYADRLNNILKKSKVKISNNLNINTNIEYFDVGSFLKIIDLIESYKYTTLFIDDINYFVQNNAVDYFSTEIRNQAILALKFIVEKYNVRIIFTINIDKHLYNTSVQPDLGDFAWSRLVINDCDQVIALNKLDGIEDVINNKTYEQNSIQVYNLKNDRIDIESCTVVF